MLILYSGHIIITSNLYQYVINYRLMISYIVEPIFLNALLIVIPLLLGHVPFCRASANS